MRRTYARLSDPQPSGVACVAMGIGGTGECGELLDRQIFGLYGRTLTYPGAAETQRLLAAAHADRIRPLCLCRPGGVTMYVARIETDRFVIKRMPDSGPAHAHHCPSCLPPEALSGLGQVLGQAITVETDSGLTAIRLGFRLSRTGGAGASPSRDDTASASGAPAGSVASDTNRLSLRALLHYLWHEAELATWSPGMAGKRNWRVVSWHLRSAAGGKFTRGQPLLARLYVPEPFTAEKKAEIAARRRSAWAPLRPPGRRQQFMLLIGEVKAIEPARSGHKLIIKHLPDAALMVDDALLARLTRRFRTELDLWRADEAGHLMVIATFSVGHGGAATAEEVSVVMTDRNWLPYESVADKILLETAVAHHRRFTKSLRYNLAADKPMASLVFTDTETPTAAFLLGRGSERPDVAALAADTRTDSWTWVIGDDMPRLPRPTPTPQPAPPANRHRRTVSSAASHGSVSRNAVPPGPQAHDQGQLRQESRVVST